MRKPWTGTCFRLTLLAVRAWLCQNFASTCSIPLMKNTRLLTALSLSVLLCQCASSDSSNGTASTSAAPAPAAETEADTTLKAGMSKAEVIAKWGEPSSKKSSAGGEVWRYASQGWKRHVPYYGTFAHVEEHFVLFGADGRVVKTGTEDFGNAFQEPWRRAFGTN